MSETLTATLVGSSGGTVTKVVDIVLQTDSWYSYEGMWSQIVEVAEASKFSKIDLQPSAEQNLLLQSLGTTMTVENASGVITVYAVGDKPTTEITIQATLTEIIRVDQGEQIYGNTVGWPITSLLYPTSV